MPILAAYLLMAQGTNAIRVALPVANQRPSRLMKKLESVMPEGVTAVPDDENSNLIAVGSKAAIDELRTRMGLFDVRVRKARLAIEIVSPINHGSWSGEIEAHQNLAWEGADGATGVKLSIAPRMNDDGTCTLFIKAKSEDVLAFSVAVRTKLNEEQKFTMKAPGIRPASANPTWMPRITVKFLGDAP